MECRWKNCKNVVLMDDYCSRHLKQQCSICFEQVPSTNSARTKRLSCGHSYHFRCILKWFELSEDCPVCRKKQSNDDIIIFKNNVEETLRSKYKNLIKTYEKEISRLRNQL